MAGNVCGSSHCIVRFFQARSVYAPSWLAQNGDMWFSQTACGNIPARLVPFM